MFNNIIKQAEKAGIKAAVYNFQSGYYFDGKDNVFVYPGIVFAFESSNGNELSNNLAIMERIAKRYNLVRRNKSFIPGKYSFMYTTKDFSDKATEAYGKAVCFQYGFFMARYNNKSASDEELIKAGHESLKAHGYEV